MPYQADAQYLSPMERWGREDLSQSSWSDVASYTAFSDTVNHLSSHETGGQEENWSTTGNAQSEK
jgi:hypothetical protein